jgi:hypothetical protein
MLPVREAQLGFRDARMRVQLMPKHTTNSSYMSIITFGLFESAVEIHSNCWKREMRT